MAINRFLALTAAVLLATNVIVAQGGESFKGRLTSLPVDAVIAPTMTGSGSASATLQGTTLTITGEFKDLNSPATIAHVHRAPRGMRGPVAFPLTVTKAGAGTFEGKLTLSAAQIADLKKGWYYIQIHTEKNADGQLRGWLLQ